VDDSNDQSRARAARWAMLLPHRELAVGMVVRATGDLAEAEDSVHDAMLRLVRRSDLDPSRVRSLLIRAALHIAIDHRRATARQQSAVVRLGGDAESFAVSPEQVVTQRADAARILTAVDGLPRRERQVILLRLAGLSVAETAARLGISAKSVEGAYTRARARVRYLLGAAFAWVMERLRRAASPRGEALATTVAALLLLGPGWGGATEHLMPSAQAPSWVPRGPLLDAVPTRDHTAGRTAAARAGAQPAELPGARRSKRDRDPAEAGNSGINATVSVPVNPPGGVITVGTVTVTLTNFGTDFAGFAAAVEQCAEHPIISLTTGPC